MDGNGARPFRLGCFDVRNGIVVAADDALPVAVEIDRLSGEPARVHTWPLSPQHRGRSTALDILGLEESILVASPAAGGIVDIDRRSGSVTVIPLDADAGWLIPCADAVWAVATPGWAEDGQPLLAVSRGRRRPVVWEEPSEGEIARHRELVRHVRYAAAPGEDDDDMSLAYWRDEEGDDEETPLPTPIWRISAGTASRIDADLEEPALTAAGARLVGVGRLPSDPVVKHLTPFGSLSFRYPGHIVVIDEMGTVRDCRPWMPRPELPPGFDPDRFEQDQLGLFRAEFLGGWRTEDGETLPFIEDVTFDSVELRGEFPRREVVALFQAADRPGIQFGRRWPLYDELGNPVEHEYSGIYLLEDVEAARFGLPPAGDCVPDSEGVAWFL